MSEKTEDATPKKLRDARKKGQVAKSTEFTGVAVMLGAIAVLVVWAPFALQYLLGFSADALTLAMTPDVGGPQVAALLFSALETTLLILGPLLAVTFVLAAFVSALQVGALFTIKPLIPDISRLDPVKGAKNLVSMSKVVELIKNVLKLTIMGSIGVALLRSLLPQVAITPRGDLLQAAAITVEAGLKLSLFLVGSLAFFGLFDLVWKRYEHAKKLRMAKHEVKREHKESDGDPLIKGKRKQLHRELSQGAGLQQVKNADAVIVNPTHVAAALRYREDEMRAPKVLASGKGPTALSIRRMAHRHGIPIVRNVDLARALAEVDLEAEIPAELYEPVAEVLRFVYQLQEKRQE